MDSKQMLDDAFQRARERKMADEALNLVVRVIETYHAEILEYEAIDGADFMEEFFSALEACPTIKKTMGIV